MQQNYFDINVSRNVFEQIVTGFRTVEIKLNYDIWINVDAGDHIKYICGDDEYIMKIIRLNIYDSFHDLSADEDITKCFPDNNNINDCVKYIIDEYGENNYKIINADPEKQCRVMAMQLYPM